MVAEMYRKQGDYEQEISIREQILKLDPNTHLSLAVAYERAGRHADFVRACNEVATRHPSSVPSVIHLLTQHGEGELAAAYRNKGKAGK